MAKRFRFRLATVERLRCRKRDAQRSIVADSLRAVKRVEERMNRLTRQWYGTVEQTRDALRAESVDIVSLRWQQLHRGWVNRQVAESNRELERLRVELEAERAKLTGLSRELKVIEKLRERQWRRHLTEVLREEQAANDEAALQVYLRHSAQPSGPSQPTVRVR